MEKTIPDEIEDDKRPIFDYLNKDLTLMCLLILIESAEEKETEVCFATFLKNGAWNNEHIFDEITDTNDYYSVEDMVMQQIMYLVKDTEVGKVENVFMDNADSAMTDLVVKISKQDTEEVRKIAFHYASLFEQICFLKDIVTQRNHKLMQKYIKQSKDWQGKFSEIQSDTKVAFTEDEGFFRKFQEIGIELPERLYFTLNFRDKKVEFAKQEIANFIDKYSEDGYLDEVPDYQHKRLTFIEQIENFHICISRQNLIGDTINLPFSIIGEKSFEAVKILQYLKQNKVLTFHWSDEGSWKVKFLKLPITLENLYSKNTPKVKKLKSVLSFNYQTSTLTIEGTDIKIQGADQKELLKILFTSPNGLGYQWFFSEIAEEYDHQIKYDDKKFYNASYQLNKKVAEKSSIKDFLFTTQQTVKINEKYI